METLLSYKDKISKGVKLIFLAFMLIYFSLFFALQASAASVALLSWHLVDSGKHLDWDGSTAYQSQFNAGVNTWNGYKSGVIRQDSLTTVEDVAISDFYEVSSTAGVTSSAGTLRFNSYVMDKYSSAQRQNCATHELGHALGLDHNTSDDIMYAYNSTRTSLSANDKASYDAAYKRY